MSKVKELKRHYCRHCSLGHVFLCNCGHPHDEHTFMGGCTHKNTTTGKPCTCERYSQTQQKKEKEIVEQSNTTRSEEDDRAIAISATVN